MISPAFPPRFLFVLLIAVTSLFLTAPAAAQVGGFSKIDDADLTSTIVDGDRFGYATVSPGDVDNDGIPDLVVGAPYADDNDGAIYVLLLNDQGGVKAEFKISGTGGAGARFGSGIAHLGDLDRNGYPDIAVGAPNLDGTGESLRGGVTILFLDYDFSTNTVSVVNRQFIGEGAGGFGDLGERSFFGRALSGLGDVDGDGVNDLAVGGTEGNFSNTGTAWVLLLNSDGTVKRYEKTTVVGESSYGEALGGIGDLNADGVPDLAVGIPFAADGGGRTGPRPDSFPGKRRHGPSHPGRSQSGKP